jgi:ATPase subunit of ABC transporter with duplicated ATPase domains
LERAEGALANAVMEKPPGRSIFIDYEPAPASRLFSLDVPALCAGPTPLLGELHLTVGRSSRIRIAGPNGAGKTTLLSALRSTGHLPTPRVLYLPQELAPEEGLALLEEVRALSAAERGRVLSMVAALGTEPEPLLKSERPSPGEARKLALALGLGRHVWIALLDEPTNHLDLPSVERVEEALRDYPGALVLVTHDDAFARPLVQETWTIRDGRVEGT